MSSPIPPLGSTSAADRVFPSLNVIGEALPSNPAPQPDSAEFTTRGRTSGSERSTSSKLRPLEIARQRLRVRKPEPRELTPLEDFQRLFPLVDPSSPGLPYALLWEYLFRCRICDYVILKSRLNIHACPTPQSN